MNGFWSVYLIWVTKKVEKPWKEVEPDVVPSVWLVICRCFESISYKQWGSSTIKRDFRQPLVTEGMIVVVKKLGIRTVRRDRPPKWIGQDIYISSWVGYWCVTHVLPSTTIPTFSSSKTMPFDKEWFLRRQYATLAIFIPLLNRQKSLWYFYISICYPFNLIGWRCSPHVMFSYFFLKKNGHRFWTKV